MRIATGMMLTTCLLAGCSKSEDSGQSKAPAGAESAAPTTTPSAEAEASPVAASTPDESKAWGGKCAQGEEALFTCSLKNGRAVAVCKTGEGAGQGLVQYRYGKPDAEPELSWPQKSDDGKLTFASVPYSGGGEAQLSFARGAARYIVYSRVVRTNFKAGEPNDPAITDGVMVVENGKVKANYSCDGQVSKPVDVNLTTKYLGNDNEAFFYHD
ncbi:hypothetical protein GRI39_03120 [Altererythrobacter indicus]|uniref:Lipoprotein n=1 Tax=Altericroceibacterium indicum TaxID=374177 RepID=A0A845A6P8_9SPHN|nr:hypothetical protein [Altericroceibacterium indicum]MXP25039.1 hypothetical protein [Altericroceibacterium indicum]